MFFYSSKTLKKNFSSNFKFRYSKTLTPSQYLFTFLDKPKEFFHQLDILANNPDWKKTKQNEIKSLKNKLLRISKNLKLHEDGATAAAEACVANLKSLTNAKYFATYGKTMKEWMYKSFTDANITIEFLEFNKQIENEENKEYFYNVDNNIYNQNEV